MEPAAWFKLKKLKKVLVLMQYLLLIIVFVFLFRWSRGLVFPQLDWFYLFLSVAAIVLLRITSVFRARELMRSFLRVGFANLAAVQFFSIGLGLFTPGKMGESVKIVLLGRNLEEKKKITATFILEKILDTSVFLPLSVLFIFLSGKYKEYFWAVMVLLAAAVFVYVKLKRFSRIEGKLLQTETAVLTFFLFLSQVFSFWFLVLASGVGISFLDAATIWSIAGIVATVSFLPGGLGAREFTIGYLLAGTMGLENQAAAGISLLYTLVSYSATWACVLFGMLYSQSEMWKGKKTLDFLKDLWEGKKEK